MTPVVTNRILLAAVLAFQAGVVSAEYDGYRDWKLVQELVACTNAGDRVRPHWDFTNPLHGPWLSNPAYDAMTVTYISRANCAAGIEFRKRGVATWTRRWNTSYGLLDYSGDIHAFHLSGLEPGTDYEYRFVTASSSCETAYVGTCVGRETYAFRTLDPARDAYKVFVTSDVHGAMRLTGDAMYGRTDAAEADFCLMLGDNVNDNMNQPRFYITNGFIDDVVRLWGACKPTVFVRGNHDCWGRFAVPAWRDYFARPDGRGYYTVAQGPALFVVLDPNREYSGKSAAAIEVAEAYVAEQLAWLGRIKLTDEWKAAKFRIVLVHYGTRAGNPKVDPVFRHFATTFRPELDEVQADRRIHLLLCGHEHHYARFMPRQKGWFHNPRLDRPSAKPRNFPLADDATFNFTEVALGMNDAVTLEVAPDRLTVREHDASRTDADDLDAFEIFPDGSAKEVVR